MTYLIMNDEDSSILDTQARPPTQKELQQYADNFGVGVWVIEGEHYGMVAVPTVKKLTQKQQAADALSRDEAAQREFAAFNGLEGEGDGILRGRGRR